MELFAALAPFAAGLGMFFSGVHFIATSLTPLVGRRFRILLGRMSNNRWTAALTGTLAGLVTQSVDAVTSVTVGLVNANALDLRRAILIPTWSYVGTSALVILVAVDFRVAASYLIALAGIAVYFGSSRNNQSRNLINILFAVGLLFFGIAMIKSGTEPLRDMLLANGGIMAFITHAAWLSVMAGFAFVLVCQSSAVVGAMAVTCASVGLVDFTGACWMICGANLGAALNQQLLARAHHGELRQIALMQMVQKVVGFAAIATMLLAGTVQGSPLLERTAAIVADTVAGRAAWVFLAYQIIGSLVCTLARDPLLVWLKRLAPETSLQEMSKPAFLLHEAMVDPSLALDLVVKEEQRLIARLPGMLDGLRADAGGRGEDPGIIRTASQAVIAGIANYLDGIIESNPDRAERERLIRLQHRIANLGALFDAMDEFCASARAARQWSSIASVAENMVEALHALLSALVEATANGDADERELVVALLGHRDELMERMRRRVLHGHPEPPAAAQEALFSTTMLFERIVWLSRRGTLLLAPAVTGA